MKSINSYLLSSILTTISLLTIAYFCDIYPFGNNTIVLSDGNLFLGFYSYFRSTFLTTNNLFYSFSNVLGGNAFTLMAYHAFSIFHILLIFFSDILKGIHFVYLIKSIFASLSFCYLLNNIYKSHKLAKAIFSSCYALMGYNILFISWNLTTFQDAIIFLPLVVLGLYKFIDNKNHNLLYIFSLTLAIISNFYMGYMILLSTFLFYLYTISSQTFFIKKLKSSIITYATSTLLSIGLSAVVLIPAYMGIPKFRKILFTDLIKEHGLNFHIKEIIIQPFLMQHSVISHLPIIFIGIALSLLFILFFFNKIINLKQKIFTILILAIFVLSFYTKLLNIAWHGFSINNWFNYRYSFLLSFFMLFITFESYVKMLITSKISFIVSILFVFILFLMAYISYNAQNYSFLLYIVTLFSIFVLCLLLQKKYHLQTKFVTLLLISITFFDILRNDITCLRNLLKTQKPLTLEQYHTLLKVKHDIDFIKNSDSNLYRLDRTLNYPLSQSFLHDYKGTTNYASTENMSILSYIYNLGFSHKWLWGKFNKDVPISASSILGIKYILSNEILNQKYQLIKKGYDYIYKNQYAFPLAYKAINIKDIQCTDVFVCINNMYKSIFNPYATYNKKIYKEIPFLTKITNNYYKISFNVTNSLPIYLLINPNQTGIKIYRNGKLENTYDLFSHKVLSLGTFETNDNIDIYFNNKSIITPKLYYEDINLIKKHSKFIQSQNIDIKEISSSHLEFYIINSKDTLYGTSIPYDEGWEVYANGKKIKTQKFHSVFLSFKAPKGKQLIKLKFIPPGFLMGLKISIFSLTYLILLNLHQVCKNKRILKFKFGLFT